MILVALTCPGMSPSPHSSFSRIFDSLWFQDDPDCDGVVDEYGAATEKCCKNDGICIAEADFDVTACGKKFCYLAW